MSSINPVSRSMNGIKTIETASLIFTDDNSSLNTTAGIVSAQATSTTALNGKINSVGFNTNDGVLTLTKEDGTTLTKDLDGRYLSSLDADDIPDLNASKITEGTLGTARIPDLDADKIASGTLGTGRIPDLPYVSVGTAQTHTDETIYGLKTFVEFPKIKLTYPPGLPPVIPDPTSDEQFATKKYVDTTTGDALLGGANAFTSTNTFNNHRPSSSIIPIPVNPEEPEDTAQAGDFIMKRDGDLLYLPKVNSGVPFLDGVNNFGSGQGLGSNSFNPRPITTLTNSITSNMFITKDDAENRLDNILISGNLKGNVSTENGGGHISILPIRRTLLSNTFTTNDTGSKWIKIATLPASGDHTKDITKVVLTGGDWTSEPMIITAWFRNRAYSTGFKYSYKIEGNSQDNNGGAFTNVFLFARSVSGGAVDIWIFLDGTSNYAVADWSIDSIEAVVYKNPSSQSTPPTAGSLIFSSGNGGSLPAPYYNNSFPPNLITRQAHHSFHASWNTPNATSYGFGQGQVFKPNYLWSNIGSCYSSTTGKFTAKIRGVYMFKFSAFTNTTSATISRPALYKNNVIRTTTGNTISHNGNQVFAIIPLDIGDLVHLSSSYGGYYMYSHYQYNQFSGSLIAPY